MPLAADAQTRLDNQCPASKGAALGTTIAALQTSIAAGAHYHGLFLPVTGNVAASIAATPIGNAYTTGAVVYAAFTLGETGADGSNPLSLAGDVLINGVSVFTTPPVLSKTAADHAWTDTAGTGITPGVLNAAAVAVVAKDRITASFTLTRTASPGTEMGQLFLYVVIAYPAP